MDRNSNGYIFTFSVVMVIVVAVVLSSLATSLKPMQSENVRQEKMQNILKTFIGDTLKADGKSMELTRALASEKFGEYVTTQYALNHKGENQDGINAFNVDLKKQLKEPVEKQIFPLYEAEYEGKSYYIVPLRGAGLWDAIWGYVALEEDLNTIKGVIFDHKGETAGLGAEITTDWFQESFVNEKIYNEDGALVGVEVKKGYQGGNDKSDNAVNAISGATITGDGVTAMIQERLTNYKTFFEQKKQANVATR